jgi:hypothetical protein
LDEVPFEAKPKHLSFIYAGNDLTDEFLFGDDIMIPKIQTKKGGKNRTGGPKAITSESVSSDNEKTEDESSS